MNTILPFRIIPLMFSLLVLGDVTINASAKRKERKAKVKEFYRHKEIEDTFKQQKKHIDSIKEEDIDKRDEKGRTPLMLACMIFDDNGVETLLKGGANLQLYYWQNGERTYQNAITAYKIALTGLKQAIEHQEFRVLQKCNRIIALLIAKGAAEFEIKLKATFTKIEEQKKKQNDSSKSNGKSDENRQNENATAVPAANSESEAVPQVGPTKKDKARMRLYIASSLALSIAIDVLDYISTIGMFECVKKFAQLNTLRAATAFFHSIAKLNPNKESIIQWLKEGDSYATVIQQLRRAAILCNLGKDLSDEDIFDKFFNGETEKYCACSTYLRCLANKEIVIYTTNKQKSMQVIEQVLKQDEFSIVKKRNEIAKNVQTKLDPFNVNFLNVAKDVIEKCHIHIANTLSKDFDINSLDNYQCPRFFYAIIHGDWHIVEYLIKKHKANPNVRDSMGRIPLILAWDEDIKKVLIKAGADVNYLDKQGRTALMTACEAGEISVVQALLKENADITIRDAQGMSAYQLAQEESIKKLLQEQGAEKIENEYQLKLAQEKKEKEDEENKKLAEEQRKKDRALKAEKKKKKKEERKLTAQPESLPTTTVVILKPHEIFQQNKAKEDAKKQARTDQLRHILEKAQTKMKRNGFKQWQAFAQQQKKCENEQKRNKVLLSILSKQTDKVTRQAFARWNEKAKEDFLLDEDNHFICDDLTERSQLLLDTLINFDSSTADSSLRHELVSVDAAEKNMIYAGVRFADYYRLRGLDPAKVVGSMKKVLNESRASGSDEACRGELLERLYAYLENSNKINRGNSIEDLMRALYERAAQPKMVPSSLDADEACKRSIAQRKEQMKSASAMQNSSQKLGATVQNAQEAYERSIAQRKFQFGTEGNINQTAASAQQYHPISQYELNAVMTRSIGNRVRIISTENGKIAK